MKNIYIFGGAGFLGRHLFNELKRFKEYTPVICDIVNVPTNIDCESYIVDIRDTKQIETIPFGKDDIVINLAANQYHTKPPRKDRRAYFFDTNTQGVENLLSVMNMRMCFNMIQYTTDMTYGTPQYLPVDISHPQNPFGLYGQSKKEAEDICRKYRNLGFNITIFRPRMIVGPERLGILVKLFKLIDLNLPVPTIGRGENHYQMISVFDCVSATIAAINKNIPNDEFNLGSKNPPTIKKLLNGVIKSANSHSFVLPTWGYAVKLVLFLLNKIGIEIMYKEQYKIADKEYILDISKTEKELNWQPMYNDSDMINQAYKYYKSIQK